MIAEQFLPNPNNLSDVDHINHNKSDNHLSNLRWTSHSKNIMNYTSYHGITSRYVDEIDPEAMVCDYYDNKTGRHYFKDYYYHEGVFYYDNDMNYRILNGNTRFLFSHLRNFITHPTFLLAKKFYCYLGPTLLTPTAVS